MDPGVAGLNIEISNLEHMFWRHSELRCGRGNLARGLQEFRDWVQVRWVQDPDPGTLSPKRAKLRSIELDFGRDPCNTGPHRSGLLRVTPSPNEIGLTKPHVEKSDFQSRGPEFIWGFRV